MAAGFQVGLLRGRFLRGRIPRELGGRLIVLSLESYITLFPLCLVVCCDNKPVEISGKDMQPPLLDGSVDKIMIVLL